MNIAFGFYPFRIIGPFSLESNVRNFRFIVAVPVTHSGLAPSTGEIIYGTSGQLLCSS